MEVAFVQNLIYYIGRAYRTPDYGIWERGNKINSGNREINASSVGMALAALEALDGFNCMAPAAIAVRRSTCFLTKSPGLKLPYSLLPRESASKEVDAATLAVIGFCVCGCRRGARKSHTVSDR